jgi:hypothetical protein
VDDLSETETANTRKDRRKNRKSKTVVETMENGGQINWTKPFESDQRLAGYRS